LQNAKITCPREPAIKGTEREPNNNTDNRHAPFRCRPLPTITSDQRQSGKMPDESSVITCDRIVPTTHSVSRKGEQENAMPAVGRARRWRCDPVSVEGARYRAYLDQSISDWIASCAGLTRASILFSSTDPRILFEPPRAVYRQTSKETRA